MPLQSVQNPTIRVQSTIYSLQTQTHIYITPLIIRTFRTIMRAMMPPKMRQHCVTRESQALRELNTRGSERPAWNSVSLGYLVGGLQAGVQSRASLVRWSIHTTFSHVSRLNLNTTTGFSFLVIACEQSWCCAELSAPVRCQCIHFALQPTHLWFPNRRGRVPNS